MLNDVLNDGRIGRLIELALLEDIGMGDVTSESILPDGQLVKGEFLCKEEGVLAGLEVAALVFQYCDHSITLTPERQEGALVMAGSSIASLDGDARSILRGERTAL
ncbi:MAG: nicotinate-nucleotide diphosphorylase, partial [Bacteroidota bacterium]